MKKLILCAFLLISAHVYSQKINLGITGGLNYTNFPGTGTLNYSSSNDYLSGFRVGGLLDIGFKSFSIQPGIIFTTKGGQGKVSLYFGDGTSDEVVNKIVLSYLEIPINMFYRFKAENGSVFIGGGPYTGIGVSGKISYATNKSYGTSQDLTFGSSANNISLFDFGINFLEGYQFNTGFIITGGYCLGLSNPYNNGAVNKNRGFNLSVGYFFK